MKPFLRLVFTMSTLTLCFASSAQDPMDSLFEDRGISTQKNKISIEAYTLRNLPVSICYERFINAYNSTSILGLKASLTPLYPFKSYHFRPWTLYHMKVEDYTAGALPISLQFEIKHWASDNFRPEGIFWGFNYRFSNFLQADFHDGGIFLGKGAIYNDNISISGKFNFDFRNMVYKDKELGLWTDSGTGFAGLIYLTFEVGYLY